MAKVYDLVLQDSNEASALDCARRMVWNEIETTDDMPAHYNYIDTVNGIGVYYDYGACYYFFTDEIFDDE